MDLLDLNTHILMENKQTKKNKYKNKTTTTTKHLWKTEDEWPISQDDWPNMGTKDVPKRHTLSWNIVSRSLPILLQ